VVEGSIPVYKVDDDRVRQSQGVVIRVEEGVIAAIEKVGSPLIFTIHSAKNPNVLLGVESGQSAPDNFRVGNAVSVKGIYDSKAGKFMASEVVTACPSRYKATGPAGPPEHPPPERRIPADKAP
jgi:hypothetical protein